MAFSYYTKFTVNTGQVPSAQTNFPMLLLPTDNRFRTVGNGGHVQNSNGYDIRPYSDSALTSPLNYELVAGTYNASTGFFEMRVNVASLADGSAIYLAYGDPTITTDGSSTAAWNSNFKLVAHYPNGSSLSASDSTAGANTGTITSATATSGKIDGAANFSGASNISFPSSADYDSTLGCWSFWMNSSMSNSGYNLLMSRADSNSHSGITIATEAAQGDIFIQIYNSSGFAGYEADHTTISPHPNVLDSNDHLIEFEFNGTSTPTLYIDAVATTYIGSNPSTWAFNSQAVRNAKALDSFWTQYAGKLDEVWIMNNNPGANWHTTKYNNENAPGTFYSIAAETPISSVNSDFLTFI